MRFLKCFMIIMFLPLAKSEAQNFSKEFGKIGKEESALVSYTPDKSASAVVIFDIGKSHFQDSERGFDVIFEKSSRIKIFSEAGLKWAQVEIPYYHENGVSEEIFDLEAFTYNPSGDSFTRTSLNPATCFDEKLNEYWNIRKFAMPDVKAGSIIEYRYKLRSQNKFNLRDWEFQSRIPTIYSEFQITMVPFYEYTWLLQGAGKFDSNTSYEDPGLTRRFGALEYKELVHKFAMKNLPAFNDEEYITSINDYIIKLQFQLVKVNNPDGTVSSIISTWPDLVKNLMKDEDLAKFAKKCGKLSGKFFSQDSLLNKTPAGKFNYVLNYIKSNFNWNQEYGKYSSKSPGDLLKDKIGNAADLNLLAVGLLDAAGIEVYPLIISTRDHGKLKSDYPLLKSFNYVIICAKIDGKTVLADATEVLCPNDMIPSRCLNDRGLLIKEGPVEWVNLQNSIPSEILMEFKIDPAVISSDANTRIITTGYDALRFRHSYGDDKKKIVERETSDEYKIDESSVMISNTFFKDQPYIVSYNTACRPEVINEKIYVSPFLNEPLDDNPLKQNSRTYPIDMSYPVKRSYKSSISIPAGYKVEFTPEDGKILNDKFELNYTVNADNKTISVSFDYTFRKPLYPATDYLNLKYYFKEIVRKGNEKIVLVKNS